MLYSRALVAVGAVAVLAWTAMPAAAQSRSVYLNDTNINTLRSQTFENVTVEIDDKGNVHIRSDKYLIHTEKKGSRITSSLVGNVAGATKTSGTSAAKVAEEGPEVSGVVGGGRYYLVSEENVPGHTQYTFDVFLNGKFVKTVKSGDGAVLEDITRHIALGENTAIVKATKSLEGSRKSSDSGHYLRIYIAQGKKGDKNAIFMENPVFEFKRTAAELENTAQQMTFKVP